MRKYFCYKTPKIVKNKEINEYQNIIDKIENFKNSFKINQNPFVFNTSIESFFPEIIALLNQNKQCICSKLQSDDKEINSYKNMIETIKQEKEREVSRLQNINEENSKKVKKYANEIKKLNQYLQSKDNEDKNNNKLIKELEDYKNTIILKEKEIETLKNNLQLQSKKIEELQLNQKEIESSNKHLKLKEEENLKLKDNLKIKEKELEDLKNKLKNKDNCIELLKKDTNTLKNNYQLKEKELFELNDKFKLKENEIKTLKDNFQANEKKFNKLNEDLKLKINEIENLKKSLKAKEDEIIKFNSDKKGVLTKFQDKENIIKNLQNDINKKDEKFNELEKKMEESNAEIKKLKTIEMNMKNLEKDYKKLETMNKNLLFNTSTREEFLNNDLKQFYDVVIEIDSINKLTKSGWKINYNENRKEIYEKIIKSETLKIGVLGLNNVGKSFILGLLSGITIPTGWSIETKGISIKYTEGEKSSDKNICLLDSAGFETPLLNNEIEEEDDDDEEQKSKNENKYEIDEDLSFMEKLEEISKDKEQTEHFIEQLIISLSDMLILVVGKLTRKEQNFISRIKNIVKEKENSSLRSVIIIHNLAHFNEKIEIENHIKNVLKTSATFQLLEKKVMGIQGYEDRVFYTEKDFTDHFIMARHDSKAGEEYNNLTIELIKRKYNECKSREKMDIPQEIINLFSKMSLEIVEGDIEIKNLHISEDKKTITLNHENRQENQSKKLKIQKTYVDESGKIYSSNKYTQKSGLYAYKEKSFYILLIRVEIPGKIDNLTASYLKYGKKNTILIRAKKSKDEFPEMKKKNFIQIQDNRNYEEIKYLLELKDEIELNKETPIEKTQICEFDFNRNNIDPSFVKEDSDDDDNEDECEDKDNSSTKKEEIIKIASGTYVLKFYLTETSWKKLNKKYKK